MAVEQLYTLVPPRAKSGFRERFEVSEEQRRAIYVAFEESNRFTGYSN